MSQKTIIFILITIKTQNHTNDQSTSTLITVWLYIYIYIYVCFEMTKQQFYLYYPNILMNWSDAIKTFHTTTRHEPTSHFCLQYYHIHDAFSIINILVLNTWYDLQDNLIFIQTRNVDCMYNQTVLSDGTCLCVQRELQTCPDICHVSHKAVHHTFCVVWRWSKT